MYQNDQLPPLNHSGYLPEGVHNTSLETMQERFVINPLRCELWGRFQDFLTRAVATGFFSHAYIDGGFITGKPAPQDIDLILQTKASYGPEAFKAMEPFFAEGLDKIHATYSVHLHFWCEGFPGGIGDFRRFFQYVRPQDAAPLGLKEGAKKGIVRIQL